MKIAKKIGVLAAAVVLVGSSPAIASASEVKQELRSAATKNSINDIFREANDKCGRHAVLRRGYYNNVRDKGFGADKMGYKHNLTNHGVFNFLLGNPNCGVPDSGGARKYDAYAHYVQCGSKCQITQIRHIFGIIDFSYRSTIPGQKGLITAYCDGQIRCDNWVSDSINLKSAAEKRTVFSYQKLDPKRQYTEKEISSIS